MLKMVIVPENSEVTLLMYALDMQNIVYPDDSYKYEKISFRRTLAEMGPGVKQQL